MLSAGVLCSREVHCSLLNRSRLRQQVSISPEMKILAAVACASLHGSKPARVTVSCSAVATIAHCVNTLEHPGTSNASDPGSIASDGVATAWAAGSTCSVLSRRSQATQPRALNNMAI